MSGDASGWLMGGIAIIVVLSVFVGSAVRGWALDERQSVTVCECACEVPPVRIHESIQMEVR